MQYLNGPYVYQLDNLFDHIFLQFSVDQTICGKCFVYKMGEGVDSMALPLSTPSSKFAYIYFEGLSIQPTNIRTFE